MVDLRAFRWLWFMWLVGLVYDVAVSQLGWFPDRSLADRLRQDFDIAWFLGFSWLPLWITNKLSAASNFTTPRASP